MQLNPHRRTYLRNLTAHLAGLYGAKAFDVVVLAAVTRAVPMGEVGIVFLSDAIAGVAFRLIDCGLFPVLFRRSAREQAGPSLLAAAALMRLGGLLALTGLFYGIARAEFSDESALATAFFVLAGLYDVHEVPRAVLAGREKFALTASAGVVTKGLEAACTIAGLFFGAGIWSWALGRTVSQVGMVGACYVMAHQSVRRFPSPPFGEALREGLPFWFVSATTAGLSQIDTLVVGAYLGTVESAQLGIARRVLGSVMSFVGSISNVAFPELARKSRRFPTRTEVRAVVGVALGITTLTLLGAPLVVYVITGKADNGATHVLRAMAPAIALVAIERALTVWLQAKNKERTLAVLSIASAVAAALALFVFVPAFGTVGAAFARVFGEAASVALLGALAYVTTLRIASPLAFVVSRLPGGTALVRLHLNDTIASYASRLMAIPGILHVEISGSARDPRLFRPGASDLDFLVTTRSGGEALVATSKRCENVARARTVFGKISVQVMHPDVLGWARGAGHPVFPIRRARTVAGAPIDPPIDPVAERHWALTHAFTMMVRLQATAIEDSLHDGATRADRILKDFRFLADRLRYARAGHLGEGATDGFDMAESLASGAAPRWLTPRQTASVLSAAHRELANVYETVSLEWNDDIETTPEPPAAPPWIDQLGGRIRHRTDDLARACPSAALLLTPTGPTDDDPMLALIADEWSPEEWLGWLRVVTDQGRLPLPFRAYKWPVLVSKAQLRADTFVEHGVLFHLARAHGALRISGESPRGLVAPADVVQRAAVRETLQALIRIPGYVSRLAAEPVWRPADLAEPRGIEDQFPFRVRALLGGRLGALSLLLDERHTPADRDGVARAYVERYDDALAALMKESPRETSGRRIAAVLSEWAEARIARLRELLDPPETAAAAPVAPATAGSLQDGE